MALWKPTRRTILRAGGLIAAPAIIGRAMAQIPLTGAGRGAPGGAAPSTTAWDPTQKAAAISLTNSNLTATAVSPPTANGVRSVASASSGKKYWEFSVSANVGQVSVGIATAAWDYTLNFLGQGGASVGLEGGGSVFGASGNGTHFAAGDRCCLALDVGGKLLWCKNLDGTNLWNADGSANPATGVGGIDVSAYTAPFFAGVSFNTNADSLTANFGATAYAGPVPSSFVNW